MILLSDLHLDTFRQWSTLEDGINTRLLDQIRVIADIAAIIEQSGEENVIFLGDLINSFSDSLPKVVYNAVWYAIHSWSQKSRLYIIAGNHDLYRGRHIFDPYRYMENVEIVTSPVRETLEGYAIDMVPWGYDIPDPKDRGDILTSHQEVYGAIMNVTGIATYDGIRPSSLAGYKYVFLGHYHEAQKLDVPGAKWAGYIGSIMQTDLSLSPAYKGITFFNKDEVRFEPIASPRLHSVKVASQEEADKIIPSIVKGDYWRITVLDQSIKLPSFDHRVQVEYDIKPKTETRLEAKDGEDLLETVLRFIDIVDTKVDKELAKELVGEVMR